MSAAGQIIESVQLLEMIINNEYGDDIDDDDDGDDIDDVMKEGRLLIGQRGVSNSMLFPAIPVIIIVIKVISADFMIFVICSAVTASK